MTPQLKAWATSAWAWLTSLRLRTGLRKLLMVVVLLPSMLYACAVLLVLRLVPALRPLTWRGLLAQDQVLNAALEGYEDEKLSSRAAKARAAGKHWGCVLCRVLDWIDPDHCNKSLTTNRGK